jgi:hypothetical protein
MTAMRFVDAVLERHERKDLDAVAVVDQRVENAVAGEITPRFGHDDDVGVEPEHDLRDVEARSAPPAPALDAPVGVERRDGELRCVQVIVQMLKLIR